MLPTATTTTQPQPPPPLTRQIGRQVASTSTPARLAVLRAALIVLALVFAVGGAFGINRRANAIDDVRSASGQLLALQDIRVRIVHADSIASSSYLRSGLEDPAQRTAYLDEIAKAGDGLVAVSAKANAADLVQLSEVSRLLGSYVGLVEQARANNRQGFPVGAAYQRQANSIVSNNDPDTPDIVSSLQAVETSQRDQINDSLATAHRAGLWMQLTGWVLLIALGLASWWMFLKFRRVLNVPIAGAAVVLFLLLVIGGSTQGGSVSDADDAVGTQLASADNAGQGRAAGFEARSQEALTLVNRGNGAANEANWQVQNNVVLQVLDGQLGSDQSVSDNAAEAWENYVDGHVEIRTLDDGGNWNDAVLVSLGEATTANFFDVPAQFDDFDRNIGQIVVNEGSAASGRLVEAVSPLRSLRNTVFVAGLVVAVLAALGCGQRLREYR